MIQYKYNYSKTSGHLWLFYREEPVLDYYKITVSFADNNTADLVQF